MGSTFTNAVRRTAPLERLSRLEGLRLDYTVIVLMLWTVVGLALDIQKHSAGFSFAAEGFVTPEHSVIYTGGIGICLLFLGVTYARRVRDDVSWIASIPPGYGIGFVGLALFFAGGVGDFFWHSAFGAEGGSEALVSPTHLLLVGGGILFGGAPLRAAWLRRSDRSWRAQFPTIFLAGLLLFTVSAFTGYAHPLEFATDLPANIGYGLAAIMFQMAVLLGICVVLVRRFDVVTGGYTFFLVLAGVFLVFMDQGVGALAANAIRIAPYLAAGIAADLTARAVGTPARDANAFRVFCVSIPVAWTATYFASVATLASITWTTHVWTGAITLAGAVGLFMSLLLVPSRYDPTLDPERGDSR